MRWNYILPLVVVLLVSSLTACTKNSDGSYTVDVPPGSSFGGQPLPPGKYSVRQDGTAPVATISASGQITKVEQLRSGSAALPDKSKLISDRQDFARVVEYDDGTIRTDQLASELREEQPAYEVKFTPSSSFGTKQLVFEGIRVVLMVDGQVLVRNSNGTKVTIQSGKTYTAQGEAGPNSGFKLMPEEQLGTATDTSKTRLISDDGNAWFRVVETPSKRIFQDRMMEGDAMTGYTVKFMVPKDDLKIDRFFMGKNAVLYDVDGNRLAGNDNNVKVQLVPGITYVVIGGAKNGGFSLETSPTTAKPGGTK